MIKKHWIYAEMSYMFYHLFFAADFLGFYRENFISSFVKTFVGIYDRRMMKQE